MQASMWGTIVGAFLSAMAASFLCFAGNKIYKLIQARKRRRSNHVELTTLPRGSTSETRATTFASAPEPPSWSDEAPPPYEAVVGSAAYLSELPPSYSSLMISPTAPCEDNQPLLNFEEEREEVNNGCCVSCCGFSLECCDGIIP